MYQWDATVAAVVDIVAGDVAVVVTVEQLALVVPLLEVGGKGLLIQQEHQP